MWGTLLLGLVGRSQGMSLGLRDMGDVSWLLPSDAGAGGTWRMLSLGWGTHHRGRQATGLVGHGKHVIAVAR